MRANGAIAWRTYLFPSGTDSHDYDMDQDGAGGLVALTAYGHPIELENQIRAMRLDSTGAKIWPDETFDLGSISQPIGMKVRSSTRSHTYPRIIENPGLGFYLLYFENPAYSSRKKRSIIVLTSYWRMAVKTGLRKAYPLIVLQTHHPTSR